MTSGGLCSFNWIQAGKIPSFDRALRYESTPDTNRFRPLSFHSFVFKWAERTRFHWRIGRQSPGFDPTQIPWRGHFPFCVYGQAAVLMRSGEGCNLLGFHTNGIVEEPLLKKRPRSVSLWSREADKGGGRQAGGGVEDEMEAGHKAECRQGGTTGSVGHFNLWIHCFPLWSWKAIFMS